jgi:hypothetical protein
MVGRTRLETSTPDTELYHTSAARGTLSLSTHILMGFIRGVPIGSVAMLIIVIGLAGCADDRSRQQSSQRIASTRAYISEKAILSELRDSSFQEQRKAELCVGVLGFSRSAAGYLNRPAFIRRTKGFVSHFVASADHTEGRSLQKLIATMSDIETVVNSLAGRATLANRRLTRLAKDLVVEVRALRLVCSKPTG